MDVDEVERLLGDARVCADACEAELASADGQPKVDALIGAAATCRVLEELVDQQPELFLAAVRLCRDLCAAVGTPEALAVVDSASVVLQTSR